jgi:hypothetical protein
MRSSDVANALATGNYMWLISAFVQNAKASPAFAAYITLYGVAPELTRYLEANSSTVSIEMMTLPEGLWGFTTPDGSNIGLNNLLLDKDPRALVSVMGHEGFHAAQIMAGISGRNIATEAFAHSFGWWVGWKLGYDAGELDGGVSTTCSIINPYFPTILDTNLAIITKALGDAGYNVKYQTWPSTNPFAETPWDDPYSRFLIVAKSVWCMPMILPDWP